MQEEGEEGVEVGGGKGGEVYQVQVLELLLDLLYLGLEGGGVGGGVARDLVG